MDLLATNLPGQLRMLDVIRASLKRADAVALSVSFLRYSGLQLLIEDFKAFVHRGGHARILTSTYLGITQPEALRVLAKLPGIEVRLHLVQENNQGFHPKFFVFSGSETQCWVGSSNLSKGGLTTNIEANLQQSSPLAVQQTLAAFEVMWDRPDVFNLSDSLTDAYAKALLDAFVERQNSTLNIDWNRPSSSVTPRPNEAQKEALLQLKHLRDVGETKAVIIAAPGVGKTFLAAFDALAAGAQNVLFISHRLEHLTQAQRTFEVVFGGRKSSGLVYGNANEYRADLVFSTIQSAMSPELLNRRFDYVIVDEFHHASAPSYRRFLDHIRPGFLLGLTATPERQDGHEVLALCDYNIAYEVRLIEAINRAWLVPFHYFGIADTTVDYSASFWRSKRLDLEKVETALMLSERVDHILEHANEKGYDGAKRATVGFCAGRRHARFMASELVRRGFCAEALTGEDSLERRQAVYAALEDPVNPLQWLFVADLLNEGVDIPGINSLIFLRPTDSATIFIQQLGRGLRLSPQCEVLTVLDFVGHHKNAWLSLEALHDKHAPPGPTSIPDLDFTPPKHCEVIFDDLTLDVLRKVRAQTQKKRDVCIEVYRELRQEMGAPPFPVDLIGRQNSPSLGDFRAVFGSWLECRVVMGDAQPWERAIEKGSPAYELLAACERDWQQPRVYAYALLWSLCSENSNISSEYDEFFQRFPRWMAEYAPLNTSKVWETIEKKLPGLVKNEQFIPELINVFPDMETLRFHVEKRIQYTLEIYYRMRHGGTLRDPSQLVIHRAYSRPEAINYFGFQYDPATHNAGVITFKPNAPFPNDIVLITKIDTSGAKKEFHYQNRFENAETFHWQSQNKQRQDNASGRLMLDHQAQGRKIHLFVQSKSHSAAYYLGLVDVESVSGNAPMNVVFHLRTPVAPALFEVFEKSRELF